MWLVPVGQYERRCTRWDPEDWWFYPIFMWPAHLFVPTTQRSNLNRTKECLRNYSDNKGLFGFKNTMSWAVKQASGLETPSQAGKSRVYRILSIRRSKTKTHLVRERERWDPKLSCSLLLDIKCQTQSQLVCFEDKGIKWKAKLHSLTTKRNQQQKKKLKKKWKKVL